MFLGMSTILLWIARLIQISEEECLSPYYWQEPSMSKFIELMECDRCKIISKLAVFKFKSLKLLTES